MKEKSAVFFESAKPRRFSVFPQPLAKTLTQVVKPVYKKHGFAEHRILTEWDLIVGKELASCSLPQKLVPGRGKQEGGTIYILAAAGRALELQHMQPVILDRIATYFGYPAVSRLHFVQVHSALFRKEKAKIPLPAPPPDEALLALAGSCEDEALRRALISLTQAFAGVEN